MNWTWRVDHYTPTGAFIESFTPDSTPTIASIDRMIVRGNGDCVEATFSAVPSQVNIRLRDVLHIFIEDLDTDDGPFPVFYGIVVKAGSPRSHDVQQFRIAGMSKRVQEIPPGDVLWPNPFPVISEDVSVAAKRAAQFVPSELATYSNDTIPFQSFNVGPMIMNQAPAGMILDELVKRVPGFTVETGSSYDYEDRLLTQGEYVPPTEWGVNAKREIFFKRFFSTMHLTEGVEVSNFVFHEHAKEELYTVAAAIIPAGEGGTPASIKFEDADLVARYGRSIKRFSVDSLFIEQTGGTRISTPAGLTGWTREKSTDGGATWSAADDTDTNTILQDRSGHTLIRIKKSQAIPINTNTYRNGIGYVWSEPQYVMEVVAYPKYSIYTPPVQVPAADYEIRTVTVFALIDVNGVEVWEPIVDIPTMEESTVYINQLARGIMVGGVHTVSDQSNFEYQLAELHVKPLDLSLVERIARSYLKQIPEDKIELICYDRYIEPAVNCLFDMLNGDTIEMDVTEIQYSITTSGGIMTTITLGQAYDPDTVAESELIKKNIDIAQIQLTDWTINNT